MKLVQKLAIGVASKVSRSEAPMHMGPTNMHQ